MASARTEGESGPATDPSLALALAYAPRDARPVFDDLFALDRRLADAVRQASEPIIAQLKLAWWRDRFAQDRSDWPKGEPLLARLAAWDADVSQLASLVDGWEALLAEGPLTEEAITAFGEGRAHAWALAAAALGHPGTPSPDHCCGPTPIWRSIAPRPRMRSECGLWRGERGCLARRRPGCRVPCGPSPCSARKACAACVRAGR